MAERRKDHKGRNLKTGEYYNKNTHTYQYRIMRDGKRFTITDSDLGALRKKEVEFLAAVERGAAINSRNAKMTLDEYFDFWITTFAKGARKPTTCTNYKSYYHTYIKGGLGKKLISKITKVDCQLIFNQMVEDGKKHSTMANLKSCLNKVFECAVDDGLMQKNPLKTIELSQTESKGRDSMTEEQMDVLMDYLKNSIKDNFYYALFVVLLNSGMRVGELAALTWDDIDFKEETILITKTINRFRKKDFGFTTGVGTPKSKTSTRNVVMNGAVKQALLSQKLRNPNNSVTIPFVNDAGKVAGKVSNFVFLNKKGAVWTEPVLRDTIIRIVDRQNKLVEGTAKTKLQYFCPHMTRHTFTSVAYSAGADVKAVSEILGHASTAITLDRYAHLTEAKKEEQKKVIKGIRIS